LKADENEKGAFKLFLLEIHLKNAAERAVIKQQLGFMCQFARRVTITANGS
jgi:hypothetical protein